MKEIAISRASKVDATDFAFWAKAIEIQVARDLAPAWGPYLPLGALPVVPYGSVEDLALNSAHTVVVVDAVDDANLAGYHSGLRAAGYAFGRSLPDSVVVSHEVIELIADPFVDFWAMDDATGLMIARELCDPVQNDTYQIDVELMGVSRSVAVSNFVYPRWFGMINAGADVRFDHLGLCSKAFENRGYLITRDQHNTVKNVFASRVLPSEMMRIDAKKDDRFSRTGRRG